MDPGVDPIALYQYMKKHGKYTTLWIFDDTTPKHGETLIERLIRDGNAYMVRLLATTSTFDEQLGKAIREQDVKAAMESDIDIIKQAATSLERTMKDYSRDKPNETIYSKGTRDPPRPIPEEIQRLDLSTFNDYFTSLKFTSLNKQEDVRYAYDSYIRKHGLPEHLNNISVIYKLIDDWGKLPKTEADAELLQRLALYSLQKGGYTRVLWYALSKDCPVGVIWALNSLCSDCTDSCGNFKAKNVPQDVPEVVKTYHDRYSDALKKVHDTLCLCDQTLEKLSRKDLNPLDLSEDNGNEYYTLRFVIRDWFVKQDLQDPRTFYPSIVRQALDHDSYLALWLAFTSSDWALAGANNKEELRRAMSLINVESHAIASQKLLRDVLKTLREVWPDGITLYEPPNLAPVPPEYLSWCEIDSETSWTHLGINISSLCERAAKLFATTPRIW